MVELDTQPTMEELSKAINRLSCGKAPGSDGIPSEVLKSPAIHQQAGKTCTAAATT